jgi:hypothetical protein
MVAGFIRWLWSLGNQDLAALIGLFLIVFGIALAVLRKIGDWT